MTLTRAGFDQADRVIAALDAASARKLRAALDVANRIIVDRCLGPLGHEATQEMLDAIRRAYEETK